MTKVNAGVAVASDTQRATVSGVSAVWTNWTRNNVIMKEKKTSEECGQWDSSKKVNTRDS